MTPCKPIQHGFHFQPTEFNDMNHETVFRAVLATLVLEATIAYTMATLYCSSMNQCM